MGKYIDMHVHTNKSDGMFSCNEVVDMAHENNTEILAITDHDTINGINMFQNCLYEDMKGVKGVEFSSYIIQNGQKIRLHILGYGFDENNEKLAILLTETKEKRLNAHIELLNFLQKRLKKLPEKSLASLDMEKYCWFDREVIKCMEQENFPLETINYYKQYFKTNRFSYGTDYDLPVSRVIDGIHAAGGLVVFAHPMAYKLSREQVEPIIKNLVSLGIDGIEVYQSDCSYADSEFLQKQAAKYNVLTSVGSDFHRLINSDGRLIGHGIDDNLCIQETSLTNKILSKKMYFSKKN